jgi:asparagine synthase (glutamine-hydrolysing)
MLEGVDRLVDLTSARPGGNPAAADALQRGDLTALADVPGQFAGVAREGHTVRLARTIGVPLRYFVAKMYHGPFLVVADRIDRIFEWCCRERIAWQFDPAYTRMVPAHYVVEIDQVGCPDPAPRYRRFFTPGIGGGPEDLDRLGVSYVAAAYDAVEQWVGDVPAGEPIAVAFSGGVDSTCVLLLARKAMEESGRDPDDVRAFTLDLGGGHDAAQAGETMRALGLESSWERILAPESSIDLEGAIRLIEDYHPLDVECAAMSVSLLRGIRARYPDLRYLLDGDGGDENLKSYPLEDSDLTLSSVLSNPLLYQEGWGVDAIKHSLVYSGGLSRGYMRTYAPAAAFGFTAGSPFTARPVIAAALAMPFESILTAASTSAAATSPGVPVSSRLETLKQEVVARGIRSVIGGDMPVHATRRFQDGAAAAPRARVTKAWCRRVFDREWQRRLRAAEEMEWRSGNEMTV